MLCDSLLKRGVICRLIHEAVVGPDLAGRLGAGDVLRRVRHRGSAATQCGFEVLVCIGGIVLVLRDVEDDGGSEFEGGRDVFGPGFRHLCLAQTAEVQL